MIEKIRKGIDNMDYNDLIMEQELKKGAPILKTLIQQKIQEIETKHTGICANCGNKNNLNYTLIFGSEDFKKKASFCGVDCLEYFLVQLKK